MTVLEYRLNSVRRNSDVLFSFGIILYWWLSVSSGACHWYFDFAITTCLLPPNFASCHICWSLWHVIYWNNPMFLTLKQVHRNVSWWPSLNRIVSVCPIEITRFPAIIHYKMAWCHLISLHYIVTSSNWNVFSVAGPLWGESTGHRWSPLSKAGDVQFDVFFDIHPNKRLNK